MAVEAELDFGSVHWLHHSGYVGNFGCDCILEPIAHESNVG